MIPAIDLTYARRVRSLFPQYMVVWGHPDVAKQTLAMAAERLVSWNANPANADNQKKVPTATTDNKIGLPGATVFRLGAPVQEPGLLNPLQLRQGYPDGRIPGTDEMNFVSHVPVSCEYEIAAVAKNEIDIAIMTRALWFSWANQPLEVSFLDGKNNEHRMLAPIYPLGSPTYSFEPIPNTGQINFYMMNWKWRIDGKWLNSQTVPIIKEFRVRYQEMVNGDLVVLDDVVINSETPNPNKIST